MPEYTAYLSGQSFRETARKIREYRRKLERKIEEFVEELAKEGMTTINSVLSAHVETGQTIGSVELITDGSNGVYKAKVQVTSDAIIFMEFGAGLIGYGAPHAGEFGAGPGTYPSKVQPQDRNGNYENWNNPDGWYFYDDNNRKRHVYGTVPSMPMYLGGKEMEQKLTEVAKRVFGND